MNKYIEKEIDLFDILHLLREKILIIILAALVGLTLFGTYSFFIAKPVYESTAKIYVLTQSTSLTSFADIQISSSLAKDYEKMITSRPVVRQVLKNLGLDYDYEDVKENRIKISNPEDTRVLEITCRSDDTVEAAHMANEFAMVSKRQIADIMDTDEPTIFEKAVVSHEPILPKKGFNMILGIILGIMLSSIVLIITDLANNYIRTEQDVEKHLKLNVLVSIPDEHPLDEGR